MREYENDFRSDFFNERIENADVIQKSAGNADSVLQSNTKKGKQYILTTKGIAILTAICVAISTVFGAGGAYITAKFMPGQAGSFISGPTMNLSQIIADLGTEPGGKLSVQQVVAVAADAVVEISTEKINNNMWMQYVTQGAGSGVIVSSDGYIMTNNHVISGTGKINVTLRDGTQYDAVLVGTDAITDVAVIKIDAQNLTQVVFGDSDKLTVGDPAIAIGNPLGQLGGTATEGIISALDRQLMIDGKKMSLLQTSASINPGNSGGGLFNQYGEIIGLVAAKSEGLGIEGLGFAIPANTAKSVAMQLINDGYVKGRPQIGILMLDLSSMQDAIRYGVKSLGVYVKGVTSDNAKRAGIEEGDMLYFLDDVRIEKPSDVNDALQKYSVGDKIKLTVIRNNDMKTLEVVLSEQKKQ